MCQVVFLFWSTRTVSFAYAERQFAVVKSIVWDSAANLVPRILFGNHQLLICRLEWRTNVEASKPLELNEDEDSPPDDAFQLRSAGNGILYGVTSDRTDWRDGASLCRT